MSARALLNVVYASLASGLEPEEQRRLDARLEKDPSPPRTPEERDRARTAAGGENRNVGLLMKLAQLPHVGAPPTKRPPAQRAPSGGGAG